MKKNVFQTIFKNGAKMLSLGFAMCLLISSFMFTALAKDTRDMIEDGGGGALTHQYTERHESTYSACFETKVNIGNPYTVTYQYGTTTLYNQSKSYGHSADNRYLTFYYTGMGTSTGGYMSQVSDFMAHQY